MNYCLIHFADDGLPSGRRILMLRKNGANETGFFGFLVENFLCAWLEGPHHLQELPSRSKLTIKTLEEGVKYVQS